LPTIENREYERLAAGVVEIKRMPRSLVQKLKPPSGIPVAES
jgi:hypothetical protein